MQFLLGLCIGLYLLVGVVMALASSFQAGLANREEKKFLLIILLWPFIN